MVSNRFDDSNLYLCITYLFYSQAFAELEKDTPGTIFGITHKSDGKSNTSSSFNETKTQGERYSNYEAHDRAGDERYQDEKYENQRIWKVFGGVMAIWIAYYVLQRKNHGSSSLTDHFVHEHGLKTESEIRAELKNKDIFKDA